MANTNAVFVGDGSLLIQCAEAFRNAGHEVRAVVSANPPNLDWATSRGIDAVRMEGDWASALPGDFEYLFSVANLRMLPASVLARAGKLAINFHDALLPRFAGLNATCWALMAHERVHGVTWHEMTERADAGRIVRQASFEVSPTETAMSLNAKCYEAGLASFTDIVRDLGRGELVLTPQQGEREYFGRHRRPEALGTLDFTRPARDIVALVRALDFGTYANPLARPKLYTGQSVLTVGTAQALSQCTAAPGTVLAVDGDQVRIAAADAEVVLGGCMDLQGRPGAAGISVGQVLPTLQAATRERLAAHAEALARGEVFWIEALRTLAPVELPHPRQPAATAAEPLRQPLEATVAGTSTIAGFFAWLSALSGQEQVSILYCDSTLAERASGLEPWATAWVPLTLETTPGLPVLQAAAGAETQVGRLRQAGPLTRDLVLRLGEPRPALEATGRVAVSLVPAELPPGCELLLAPAAGGAGLELAVDAGVFSPGTAQAMARQLAAYLRAFTQAQGSVGEVPLLPPEEARAIESLNATGQPFDDHCCVHEVIATQAARTPDAEALRGQAHSLSYAELERRSTALAQQLVARGVKPGDIVGLCLERSPALVVGALAIMKAGGAYLPLDPEYPRERLQFMAQDSATPLVIASKSTAAALGLEPNRTLLVDASRAPDLVAGAVLPPADPERAAYVIYTSGSTGKPKGVVVTHRNVMNFFAGMDQRVPHEPGARWLAVTSLSFDISVLELYWTLARGITVVINGDAGGEAAPSGPEFSLFYFASDDSRDPRRHYELLMEGAKFADREGFTAVWTPERHFHAFGGLYPNPVVTSAAIAAATSRVQIRAGSCVLPLHHPVRVAEDWAFVDNISNGRVGISFASGWQPNDFILMPDAFAKRQDEMVARMDVVRRLWRGEAIPFPGPNGNMVETRTLPRPVQREIPVWITAAGNPKTFEQAGAMGCRLLTHLLGQKVDDVAEKIAIYRAAWRQAGHPGEGHVTLMLHTFIGADEEATRETAREPMKRYLRSSVDLIKKAAWSFPTFVERGAASGKTPQEVMESAPLSEEEMDALLDHAFNRYYGTSALIGTPERCLELVGKVQAAGVDEIACLIDFGIAPDTVLQHLQDLKQLMEAARSRGQSLKRQASVAEQIAEHGITHLQCTPSMASMLLADAPGRAALSRLSALLVGGEALPLEMATQLRALVPGALLNMYGPTETTVWSTVADLERLEGRVPLGKPIANTRLSIRTPWGTECPALVPGELLIGGDGVTRGYLHRPELTAERFIPDAARPGERWYRTGDLVRRLPDGSLEFMGRIDHQVKLRGHRIELGEIESALLRQPGIQQAVVVARPDPLGEKFLAAYVCPQPGAQPQPAALRQAVAHDLPEIMVPATVMVLPQLPMTPNGKIDRKALPDPRAASGPRSAAAPESQMERLIAGIWQDVLGLPSVGTTDNFFDLGGHSLLVVQVQRRLREAAGKEVAITDMFRLPTIRALAAHLSGSAAAAPTAVADGLSRAQARRVLRTRGLQTASAA